MKIWPFRSNKTFNFMSIYIFHIGISVPRCFSSVLLAILGLRLSFCQLACSRAEQNFGLETETETWVVSVLVSSLETISLKSQYLSHFLRPK